MQNDDKKRGWDFPASNHSVRTGCDAPGTQTFKKDPVGSVSRETAQNVIDAKKHGANGPAHVEFHMDEVPV